MDPGIPRPARPAPPPPAFDLTVRDTGTWIVVAPTGDIDIATVDRVRSALRDAKGDAALDLREVTFLDTSGLRVIIQEDRRAREEGRRFALVAGSPEVLRVLEIAGVADRLDRLDPADAGGGGHA